MTSKDYIAWIQKVIFENWTILSSDIHYEEISPKTCYIKGKLELADKSNLFFIEFVQLNSQPFLEKYKYHWQDENNHQIARWDNVKHHAHIPTFPDHYHDETNKPFPLNPMNLENVLLEIEKKGLLEKI